MIIIANQYISNYIWEILNNCFILYTLVKLSIIYVIKKTKIINVWNYLYTTHRFSIFITKYRV